MFFPRQSVMRSWDMIKLSEFFEMDELPRRVSDKDMKPRTEPAGAVHPKREPKLTTRTMKTCCMVVLFVLFLLVGLGITVAMLQTYARLYKLADRPILLPIGFKPGYNVLYPRLPVFETNNGDEAFWCDRSDNRTDVCFMRGDVHLVPGHSTSLTLYSTSDIFWHRDEIIWPYARKWDDSTLVNVEPVLLRNKLIDELANPSEEPESMSCSIIHQSPLLIFSTGGYTGNPYHDFNDVIIPLFINSQHYGGDVVFGILDVRDWWIDRFGDLFALLSRHRIININSTEETHCFPEATIGLRVHADLAIDPSRMPNNETIRNFQEVLHQAFAPQMHHTKNSGPTASDVAQNDCRAANLAANSKNSNRSNGCQLKMVIITRKGSRMILNLHEVVKAATKNGFDVEILEPSVQLRMSTLYRSLQSADVMIGVHGAALTHILFMRPRSVFVQIVPLGTDWPARTYYQEPAENELDLQYLEYKIHPNESTLTRTYGMDNVVIKDPEAVAAKNWDIRKKMYLEGQNVRLSIPRIEATFAEAKQLATKRFLQAE